MTSKPTREMRTGRVVLRFSMNRKVEQMPLMDVQTETGSMRVGTPETTAFDLVRYPAGAGRLSNAATVLAELAERLAVDTLGALAPLVPSDNQGIRFLLYQIRAGEPWKDGLDERG